MEDTEAVQSTRQPYYHPKENPLYVTYIMKVGEEEVEIKGTAGVKQCDNLGPFFLLFSSKLYQQH